jgi:hypothetical protein
MESVPATFEAIVPEVPAEADAGQMQVFAQLVWGLDLAVVIELVRAASLQVPGTVQIAMFLTPVDLAGTPRVSAAAEDTTVLVVGAERVSVAGAVEAEAAVAVAEAAAGVADESETQR